MRSRWWVFALVVAMVMAWAAWVINDGRADARADREWTRKDAALHDSLVVTLRRIAALDSAVGVLERGRATAMREVRTAQAAADGEAARFATFRDSALAAAADSTVTRDSVSALLQAMAARAIAREAKAIEERAALTAALRADSSVIAGLRGTIVARDTALALAGRQLVGKDQRIAILERGQGISRRVAGGLMAYGLSGTCAAVGWIVMGPAGGIASGAACAVGWAVVRPRY